MRAIQRLLEVGIVTSIQSNHKEVEMARKGEEVCVKIEPIPGESPKMFGRHFDETDMLVSKVIFSNTLKIDFLKTKMNFYFYR